MSSSSNSKFLDRLANGATVRFRTTFHNTIYDVFRARGWRETESDTDWDVCWADTGWIREYFDTMLAYSPYDNVTAQNYPDLLVTAGLHDPRVQYWESAKWVAKLRVKKSGDSQVLLKTNMAAGHGGQSGRYGAIEDVAYVYAWLLDGWGLAERAPDAE